MGGFKTCKKDRVAPFCKTQREADRCGSDGPGHEKRILLCFTTKQPINLYAKGMAFAIPFASKLNTILPVAGGSQSGASTAAQAGSARTARLFKQNAPNQS